jgi:hypothetical protein
MTMDQWRFDWGHFRKCVAISAVVGLGIPVAWEIIKLLALGLGLAGQFLVLIVGMFSLYVLVFPWYLIFGWRVAAHWPYFSFANAIIGGLIWGIVSSRNRFHIHREPAPPV